MSDSSWTRISREFDRIEPLSGEDRRQALEALAPEVRREVEALLAALEENPGFLEAGRDTPETIGPYRILGEIGRGGMGVVYRAERADGEYRKQVALKLAGGKMFAPEAERRFIRERHILSQLDHPNIVRLLDGGIARGQRYFVMDLVEGTPLTEYARPLPLPGRLRLFLDVCAAIHYAHQRLVLHRDLKPANILVDREGVAKVLDFGIAQILGGETGPGGTETQLHPLSLACASPEQLRGEPLSLASDIYSLGVLLYELATGRNPHCDNGTTLAETVRRVTEELPPAPSKWEKSLAKDFDAIVLKSLAKRPDDRYASPAELRDDVERYLAGRPVTAVPPRFGYLFGRFVRRNKLLTATAAALVIAVGAGAGVYVRQARIEQRRFEDARKLVRTVVFDIQPRMEAIPATLELRRTLVGETMRYLQSVARDAGRNGPLLRDIANSWAELGRVLGDGLASNLGDRQAAAQAFDHAERFMQRALAEAPSDPELLLDASSLYDRSSSFALLGQDRPRALAQAKLAQQYAEQARRLRPGDARVQEGFATALVAMAKAVGVTDPPLARKNLLQAAELFAAQTGPAPSRNAALTHRYLASLFVAGGDSVQGVRHARTAVELSRRILEAQPVSRREKLEYAVDLGQLGSALWNASQPEEALTYFELSFRMREELAAADPQDVYAQQRLALAANFFANALNQSGRRARALDLIGRAVSVYEELERQGRLAPEHLPDFADAVGVAADIQRGFGPARACETFRRALDLWARAEQQAPLAALRKRSRDAHVEMARTSCPGLKPPR
jgi:non-specific serine/threonine protein kinase/serine/threonine-protein kinase